MEYFRHEMLELIHLFSDDYGITHLHPNPDKYGSQNGSMYSGLAWALYEELYGMSVKEVDISRKAIKSLEHPEGYQTTPGEAGTPGNCSHDNMTGIVVWRRAAGLSQKILPYNLKQWWHPRDVAFYLYARFPYIFWFLLPIASIAMIVSCAQNYKVRHGRKILKTDGKLLTFMRCRAFKSNPILKLTFKVCTWLIKRNPNFESWSKVSKMYFKDEGHPINLMMTKWEKDIK